MTAPVPTADPADPADPPRPPPASRLRRRLGRVPGQVRGTCPFGGDAWPGRVSLLGRGRPAWPAPHPWNFDRPLDILETYFHGADDEPGPARHNRYLDVPGFHPVLVTRDPAAIRAIAVATGDRPGQFDRDTLPSAGIARATGADSLLYANGPLWRRQRKLAAPPFGKTSLFQPEKFGEFADTFRRTVTARMKTLRDHLAARGEPCARLRLEPEIQAVMLELLADNFFGADLGCEEIRERYVPALSRVIDRIVRDTVRNRVFPPVWRWPPATRGIAQAREDHAVYEELTDRVLAPRKTRAGLWGQFKSDATDAKLRSNVRVFLAGALEATTSYAGWALSHLARCPEARRAAAAAVDGVTDYTPEALAAAGPLRRALDETLRLTPSLYFLPRRATADTDVPVSAVNGHPGGTLRIPAGTHVLLDVWHANRHEDFWGEAVTGFPADRFEPDRWLKGHACPAGRGAKESLHFGFGHGPRVCPGKHLGELEVGLTVGAVLQHFEFEAVHEANPPRAGVSTKPADGVLVDLRPRHAAPPPPDSPPPGPPTGCPRGRG